MCVCPLGGLYYLRRCIVLTKIEELGLTEHFEFAGVLTGAEKHEAFLDSDIFCFPTFFESESFGLVVTEAMQFELPVVASRWRGVQSLVVDEVTGFLVPPKNCEAMADSVERLVLDPKLRRQLGRAGRQRYLEEYTITRFHARYASV